MQLGGNSCNKNISNEKKWKLKSCMTMDFVMMIKCENS